MSDWKFERMGHVAIHVADVEKAAAFYRDVLGLEPGWKVEKDWTLLKCGPDDLALIRKGEGVEHPPHFGLRVGSPELVDRAFEKLKDRVRITKRPATHRDGSRSFYFADPDGNQVEVIHDPNRA